MSHGSKLAAWLSETDHLRRFAFYNIVFWLANQPLVLAWYIFARKSFLDGGGILYLAMISVAALWLSSLSWWQSTRVEERQIEAED